jgi:hypothetical protein
MNRGLGSRRGGAWQKDKEGKSGWKVTYQFTSSDDGNLHADKLVGLAKGEQEALQLDFEGQWWAGWEGEEAGGAMLILLVLVRWLEEGREGGRGCVSSLATTDEHVQTQTHIIALQPFKHPQRDTAPNLLSLNIPYAQSPARGPSGRSSP